MSIKSTTIILVIILSLLSSFEVTSKAFCALRDPVAQIYHLYPQADNYRSIVRTIDEQTRHRVLDQLPNHQLHTDELGRHTLYVALKQGKPLGIVHVRSEQSRWGLIEIAWALDLDLNVLDFNFQRSRALGNDIVLNKPFKSLLIGKDFKHLNQYLNPQGEIINQTFNDVAQNAKELSKVVLINGLKTLLVTKIAWAGQIKTLKAQRNAAKDS